MELLLMLKVSARISTQLRQVEVRMHLLVFRKNHKTHMRTKMKGV
jgi:hypothetical protein